MLSNLKTWVWRWPLLFFYGLVFGEIFVRFLHPVLVAPRYVVATEYGVRANWPSISYRHFGPEYSVEFEVNSKGVRSPREIEYAKQGPVFRVLALGDSFTMGYGASVDETYLAVLERSLAARADCPVEVINLGVSGLGTAEQLRLFNAEGVKYQPDAVILQWHESDLKENVSSGLYELDGSKVRVKKTSYLPQVAAREWLFGFAPYRFVANNSMAYTIVRNKLAKYTKRFNFAKNATRAGKRGLAQRTDVSRKSKPAAIAEDLSTSLLLELVRAVERAGAQPLVFDVPKRIDRETFESRMPAAARSSGVPIYNPNVDFGAHKGDMLYWERSAGHFTPLGNRIVGEALSRRIELGCGTP